MKQYISFIIPIVFLFVTLISCEEDTPTPDETKIVDNAEVLHIKKTEGNDWYVHYTYNSENQLTKMDDGPDDSMIMEYTYNTLGKISTMKVIDLEGSNLTTFEYDEEGELIGSSTENGLADFVYEFENDKLIRVKAYGNIPDIGKTLMVRTEFDYEGENVSEFREYTLNFMTGDLALSEQITYQHDTRKNPLYELDIENSIINVGFEAFASKNNCIKRTVMVSNYGDPIGSYDISYEYNIDGYPTQSNDGTLFTYYN